MGEHDPGGVKREGEEMVGKQDWERVQVHSPPHSKYLKNQVRNTCSSSSREMKNKVLEKRLINPTICTEQIIQRNAKNIDGRSQRFTIPMPTLECLLYSFLSNPSNHPRIFSRSRKYDKAIECDGHSRAAACCSTGEERVGGSS